MCQSGELTPEVQQKFIGAIQWLDKVKNVSAITGDCGFMIWFQYLTRQYTTKPVFMSSLMQLSSVVAAYSPHKTVAILTTNSETLVSMTGFIAKSCGLNPKDNRFLIVGCQDVPGFEALTMGDKVDT